VDVIDPDLDPSRSAVVDPALDAYGGRHRRQRIDAAVRENDGSIIDRRSATPSWTSEATSRTSEGARPETVEFGFLARRSEKLQRAANAERARSESGHLDGEEADAVFGTTKKLRPIWH
jgi:hypothetical protein